MTRRRPVFHARQGKINQIVEAFKQGTRDAPNRPLILTDLSGPMNRMIVETRHASLAAYEQWRTELFKSRAFQEDQAQDEGLIEGGSNEFYTIEQE